MNRLVVIIALACAISPVAAQKAHVDFDHACDFSHYQTYRWAGPPDMDPLNQLMQERVIGFVEEALAARHLKRVQTGGDLLVGLPHECTAAGGIHDLYRLTGFGWDAGWGSSISTTTSQVIQLGHAHRRRGRFAQEPAGFSRRVNRANQLETQPTTPGDSQRLSMRSSKSTLPGNSEVRLFLNRKVKSCNLLNSRKAVRWHYDNHTSRCSSVRCAVGRAESLCIRSAATTRWRCARMQSQKALTPGQLDSLVAPIALYPDPILSQVLVASTYPLEIVEAGRWLSQNSNLKGKALADAAAKQPWDASVQALVVLPDVLKRLESGRRLDFGSRQCVPGAAAGRHGRCTTPAPEGERCRRAPIDQAANRHHRDREQSDLISRYNRRVRRLSTYRNTTRWQFGDLRRRIIRTLPIYYPPVSDRRDCRRKRDLVWSRDGGRRDLGRWWRLGRLGMGLSDGAAATMS